MVVDTPEFGDSDGSERETIDVMVNILREEIKETNAFLLVLNGSDNRLPSGLLLMLREVQIIFGSKFWSHIILGFSIRGFEDRK